MGEILKEIVKKTAERLILVATIFALETNLSTNIISGNDSVLNRAFHQYVLGVDEISYQKYLYATRKSIANRVGQERINLIKILSFPNNVNYGDYKSR